MRIAHLATSISLNQVLLGRMIRQRELGHEVTALCPDDEWAMAIHEAGFRVIDVPWLRHSVSAAPRAALRTWRVCRRERFDIVHSTNALPGLFGNPAARLAGHARVVHTVRAWPLNEPRSLAERLGVHLLEPISARSCSAILFQNPDDMRSWESLPGVPRDRATLVGNGVNLDAFDLRFDREAGQRIRTELGLEAEALVVAVIARFEPAKGHDQLLRGLRRLREHRGTPVVALLAGTGEAEAAVREESTRLGLEDSIRFIGYRDDIPDILAASDISVLTSLYEGIPRGLMESMAAGLPVVATDVAGTRSLVVDGATGFLVPCGDDSALADRLQSLRSDAGLRARLGRAGRRRIELHFDERLVTDRVIAVYEHVRAGAPGPLPHWDL